MADAKFARCHAVTANWEGGWSNHAADPGGKTMYGITEAVYHSWLKSKGQGAKPVRNISRAEAEEIYFERYWKAVGGPTLAVGVDLAAYDAGVNSGVSRGRKWLLAGLDPKNNHAQTVKNICRQRLGFVQSLNTWKVFGKGWGNRIADIQAKGVAWALAAHNDPHVVKQQLEDEADKSKATAKTQTGVAGTAGAGGAGAVGADQVDPSLFANGWIVVGLVVLAVVVMFILASRSRINQQQAEAYAREAAAI
ncbi:glycoside hydrolase family 108 protein [Devosia chinhatensis]|uniref:Secretion activator protein n=1 Tax=Devosia chinhatensis TaxID=429727 RepID=A0A0F5FKU1_9HYPH|nr:glycosyl hydrolase 108 family protein [Devosia chinhatensis]KKB09418.1 secretion activator protein [Devosia chinhatensis]